MESANKYLLGKIANNKTNGLDSLGELHGKHFEDIVKVLESFAIETVLDFAERLQQGENIRIGDKVFASKPNNKKPKSLCQPSN